MINDYQAKIFFRHQLFSEFIQPLVYGSQTPFARPIVKQLENASSHKPSEEFVKKNCLVKYAKICDWDFYRVHFDLMSY